jgi:phytoene desaturase
VSSRPAAIVIGSGFGGLAAAIRLQARGYDVSVLEQLDAPGGRAYVHRQDGFTFDAGPTIITAPFLFDELWSLCGRTFADDVELRALDPFYRIRFDDGDCFEFSGDPEKMRREVARFSPEDVAGVERFMGVSRQIYEVGFEQLGQVPFDRFSDMLKIAPDLVKLQGYRSVYGLVSKYIRDPRLRMVFSFHPLLVGGNPFTTTAVYSLISHLERQWGVHYVMGGTGRLVNAMVELLQSLGGSIHFDCRVRQIAVDDNGRAAGVITADGELRRASVVVSNADAASTYRSLVPARWLQRWRGTTLQRSRSSMSLFVWYFGTDRRYHEVPHHMILMGPRYRGLLDDIFSRKVLSEDMSLYLHRPTATDPGLAPEGCDAFYVLSPVPNLDGATDWSTVHEDYRRKIQERLEQTVLPGLGGHVATSRVMTPLDFRDRLSSYRGAAFGHEPILRQSAWFRPHNRSEDIQGLYLVGAGTHPGAGVPGVVASAAVVDSMVPHVRA